MDHNIYLVARNNGFICRKSDDSQPFIFKLDGIANLPNIPFYYHLYDDLDKHKNDFISFRKQIFKGSLAANVFKAKVFLAVPEDSVLVDDRILQEFFLICGARDVYKIKECMLISKSASYVAITQTCRMTVLRHIKERTIQNTLYIENKEYSVEEMKLKIKALFTAYEYSNPPVILNGDNLMTYSEIGEIISPEALLDNYIEISKKLVKGKFIKSKDVM